MGIASTEHPCPLMIAGEPRDGGVPMQVRAPWDDRVVAEVATATPEDVEAALAAAAAALPETAALERGRRAAIIEAMAVALEERGEDLARALVEETGKTIRDGRAEVVRTVSTLRFAADAARSLVGEVLPLDALPDMGDRLGLTIREPVGVVAGLPAVNYPLLIGAHKIGPAIGAGCPIVLKPPDRAPLTTLALASAALEAGWPPAAVSVLPGGPEVGVALTTDPRVKLVSFTGSSQAGHAIAAQAGMKRLLLELGSNAATVVAADADLDLFAGRCLVGGFTANGQSCISVQRVYVHRSRYEEVLERLARGVAALRAGDPSDEATDVGPVIDDRSAERLEAVVADARSHGGKVLAGGGRDGRLVDPTLIAGLHPAMRLHREEAFGPVVGVAPFDTTDEAVALVNDAAYGLQAGVFTASIATAMALARRLEVGGVHVNEVSTFRPDHMPYGGVKDSGLGKEGPRYAMTEMTRVKVVTVRGAGN